MDLPVIRGKSGEYFLVLNNGVTLPTKKLKTVIPKTVKGERKPSVAKTESRLESFQIDISSQSASAVNVVSATGPFVMQSVPVRNLPVKTLFSVSENVRHCCSSAESDTPEKVKACEVNIQALQSTSPNNFAVKGNSSKYQNLSQSAVSESPDISEVKAVSVLDVTPTVPVQNFSSDTVYLSKTMKSSNTAVDTSTCGSSESVLISVPTRQSAPQVTVSTTTVQQSLPVQDLSTLVFFDLETTGLPGRGAPKVQITELSMVAVSKSDFENSQFPDLQDVRVMNKMRLCIRPTVGVTPIAAEITGLNDFNLLDHQIFDKDIANLIQIFIAKLPKPVCLLAHNGNRFDFPLLKAELQSAGVQLNVDVLTADTLNAFRRVGSQSSPNGNMLVPTKRKIGESKTERPSYALDKLYKKYFNGGAVNSHSAEGDCVALMMVCHKMKDSILPWICQNTRQFASFEPMWS